MQHSHKISTVEKLESICRESRIAGKSVALAHGTFDLLHLGHVRHLRDAKEGSDILVVTLTADQFVNKGPGRPVFNGAQRAEMLAALDFVDHVAINQAPTAEPVIHAIRPNVYVKGSDYVDADQDVTGKIVDEQRAVEQHGGTIRFTDDITFSSSELINRHLGVFEPEVQTHLDQVRASPGLDALIDLLDQAAEMRVLMIGEVILDEYQYVHPSGQPSKENIIATRYHDTEIFAGGVIAAANHAAGFCRQVDVVTVIGDEDRREDVIDACLRSNVSLKPLYRPGAPTTRKLRYVDPSFLGKLFEVQFLDDRPLPDEQRRALNEMLIDLAPRYDAILVNDFGHGLIAGDTVDTICALGSFVAVNAQTNSANRGYNLITKYPRADYICIDAPEARLAVGDRFSDLGTIASESLPARIDCQKIIITHGRHGCTTFGAGVGTETIPALTQTVVDTMGAGDAFFAITALLAKAGGRMADLGLIGNMVGALKVGIVGHRKPIDKVSVIKALTGALK
jgi:rfaE bifunctional protein nucleotidyltransferase chain/domain